jgi:hypothetical protein
LVALPLNKVMYGIGVNIVIHGKDKEAPLHC